MIALLLLACGDTTPSAPLPSRSEAVRVQKNVDLDGFCDARPRTPFAWPELDGAKPAEREGWAWVNVWATWCGPCIEEMPMLQRWEKQLAQKGLDIDLQLISADADAAVVKKFRAKHPEFPEGVRIAEADALAGWLESMGGSYAAGLPAHFFIDREGRVDCVRAGGMQPGNLADLTALLRR